MLRRRGVLCTLRQIDLEGKEGHVQLRLVCSSIFCERIMCDDDIASGEIYNVPVPVLHLYPRGRRLGRRGEED